MKLIDQSFNIVDQKGFSIVDIGKHIEYCARICYKSHDKITEDSYVSFVQMLKDRGHSRALEFGTVHLQMSVYQFNALQDTLMRNKMYNDMWLKYNVKTDTVFITLNYRYYLDILKVYPSVVVFFSSKDSEYYPKRYTVHMILSRGIMDEFRTHVGLSHLAESTRYCNYSKDKFDNDITFILPPQIKLETEVTSKNELCFLAKQYDIEDPNLRFLATLVESKYAYLRLLNNGWTPQQARDVLPLGVKSELISCGFSDAWKNFLMRRTAKDAHPMAREIALSLQKELQPLLDDN